MLANNHKNQAFWQLTAVFISVKLTSMFANLSRLVDLYIPHMLLHKGSAILYNSNNNLTYCSFSVVPPEVSPSDGVASKPISMGDPITISFSIVNEPVPNVTKEGIQWVFIGSASAVNLSCANTSKYTFFDNCLSLTVSNTEASDTGLYQIAITTDAGIGISAVGVSVSGGELCD